MDSLGPQVLDISMGKRYFLFTLACSHVLLASGEAYGWTALRPVLEKSGLFDSYDPATRHTLMNSVATMGIAGNALCKLPLGLVLDRFGPRVTSLIGSMLMMAGCCTLALCDKNSQYLPVTGYFLLGIAGPFIQMPCFQFSELFGTRKASAMAYLITCFELSTGVFVIFGQLNTTYPNIGRRELFLGYSFVGLYCLITGIFFWPDLPYRSTPPPQREREPSDHDSNHTRRKAPPQPVRSTPALMDKPLSVQICSVPFLYVVCFLSTHIFRQGFLLGTVGPQVEHFFPESDFPGKAKQLTDSFNIILPLGFIPMMFCTASGFAGYVLNRPRLAFIVVTLMSQIYGLLLLWPNEWAFLTLFVVFPVARQFVFSTFFSFSANTFGYASFGRIAGVASTVAGLLQLTQTLLVQYVEAQEEMTPKGWLGWRKLDLIMGTVPCLLFTYPVYSFLREQYAARNTADYWQPAMYADESGDSDTSALLADQRRENSGRGGSGLAVPGTQDDEDEAGAPMQLHYSEASSYGSQSASSFAALYSQYVTDDVKVAVRRTSTEDSSIHVSSFHGSSNNMNNYYDRQAARSFHGDN